MLVFNSEFPASEGRSLEDLFGVAKAWLVGGKTYPWSSVNEISVRTGDIANYRRDGQNLWLGEVSDGSRRIGGLRHEWTENGERTWVTEIVGVQDTGLCVSVRLYSDVLVTGIEPPSPRKPHIIKQLFEALGGGKDGPLIVRDKPHFLKEDDVETAGLIVRGNSECRLPVVYASVGFDGYPFIDVDTVAKWLSGVAHVVVEPSRRFSRNLAQAVGGQNAYGGAVGLYWPQGGGRPRRFLPREFDSSKNLILDLQNELREAWLYVQSTKSCTWADLREAAARHKIHALRESHSTEIDEFSKAFDEENAALRERATQAEAQLVHLRAALQSLQDRLASAGQMPLAAGQEQELYPGEISDAILATLEESLAMTGEGSRRETIIRDLLDANQISDMRGKIETAIREALANTTKVTNRELKILSNAGFTITDGGKHYKAVFADDQRYAFTIFKTASDHRSGQNLVGEMVRKLLKP